MSRSENSFAAYSVAIYIIINSRNPKISDCSGHILVNMIPCPSLLLFYNFICIHCGLSTYVVSIKPSQGTSNKQA